MLPGEDAPGRFRATEIRLLRQESGSSQPDLYRLARGRRWRALAGGARVLPRHMSEEKACYTERAGTGQRGTGLSADPVHTRGSSGRPSVALISKQFNRWDS